MGTNAATNAVAAPRKTLPDLLKDEGTYQRFQSMLGKDARSFMQNILTVYNSPAGKALAECDPESIVAAAGISASINLSILPSLGHSCIVPYKENGQPVAQWQIMWKGLVQLAHRSGQYARINLARVYDGQLVAHDEFKGTVKLDAGAKKSDRVQGYYFFFELKNGGTFEFYWSAQKCIEHGLRYSKSFQKGGGKWAEDPEFQNAGSVNKWLSGKEHFLTEGSGADAMSAKTIVKNELNKWGPLETRVKEFVQDFDQATIGADGRPQFIDTTAEAAAGDAPAKTYAKPMLTPEGHVPTPAEKLAWARDAVKKQGVPEAQFDAWLAAQPGGDFEKAEAATKAWKQVAANPKDFPAAKVFAVEAKADVEQFQVGAVAGTTIEDKDYFVVKDNAEDPEKFYTDSPEVAEAARLAQAEGQPLRVKASQKKIGKKTYRWIDALA